MHRDPVVPTAVFSRFNGLPRPLQCRHNLCGNDSVASDLLFRQDDVDHFVPIAGDVDPFDTRNIQQLPTDELCVFIHFGIVVAVAGQCIEDSVHIDHVVDDDGIVAPLRQAYCGIVHFASQQVEVLFELVAENGHADFDGQGSRSVLTLGFDLFDIG